MSKTYYEILGVEKNASEDDIKKAYRKLAMEHHPDRPDGDEAKFKEVKEAYETLSDANARAQYDRLGKNYRDAGAGRGHTPSDMEDIINQFHRAAQQQRENMIPFITIEVDLKRAFEGTKVGMHAYGQSISYQVRPGLPPGVSYADEVPIGDKKRVIQVRLLIEAGNFRFKQIGSTDGINFSGDLETDVVVDALDMILGAWITISDFMGSKLQVRVPAGFEVGHRLKVAGRGYTNWRGDKAAERGDLYLRVIPKITPIKDLNAKRVEELYNATRTPPILSEQA